ncbi:hypothetical protein [Embleya scabrispora]|uniref:hypothetical protein n=1 Tax=Embleya scabrispora TaxID=159449 RepID=UPI001374FDFC|nr:hypothetical protein [Embleya scabrispora]
MAAAAEVVSAELRGSGPVLVQTGQALARFVCPIAFGAAPHSPPPRSRSWP